MFSADEQAVLDYLNTARDSFFSAREICRRAGTKDKWESNPRWAMPILSRLVARGVVEADANGHYRVVSRLQG